LSPVNLSEEITNVVAKIHLRGNFDREREKKRESLSPNCHQTETEENGRILVPHFRPKFAQEKNIGYGASAETYCMVADFSNRI
jgi:hypothetical protein